MLKDHPHLTRCNLPFQLTLKQQQYTKIVHIIINIIPRGKSRCGSLHSSAVVEIASKPVGKDR
jgi:hypothetical protein